MFLSLAALTSIPAVLAHNTNSSLSGLLQALNVAGLDEFANQVGYLNCSPNGQAAYVQLSQGNNTIFAPTDEAWSSVNSTDIDNKTYLADLLAYHIVPGNFVNQTQTYPNVTIGRTLLNDPSLVQLEGNESQVLIWSKNDSRSFFVQNQGTNVSVVNVTTYNDSAILAVNSVLIPPPNISTVMNNASYDLTTVAGILQSTTFVNTSSKTNTSLLDVLASAHGITVFAPNNEGVQAAQGSLSSISGNTTAFENVLSNHVINGTTLYSTDLGNKTTYVSTADQKYAFSSNSTGLYVSVGGSNAVEIVQPNVLISNGVIHIVNGVMLDTNGIPVIASSVSYPSATSVTAHSSSLGETGTATPSPSPTTSEAKGRSNDWKLMGLVGLTIGLMHLA